MADEPPTSQQDGDGADNKLDSESIKRHTMSSGSSPPQADLKDPDFLPELPPSIEKKEAPPVGSWMTKTEEKDNKNYISEIVSQQKVEPLQLVDVNNAAEDNFDLEKGQPLVPRINVMVPREYDDILDNHINLLKRI